jgi:hypothetical protein
LAQVIPVIGKVTCFVSGITHAGFSACCQITQQQDS